MKRSAGSVGDVDEAGVAPVTTDSGIPVAVVYTAEDLPGGETALARRLGLPGEPPFTRGPYPTMYRGQLWTMRQFAGFGAPEHTNERFRFLLGQGQTALSVAFDLPTQLGYDSGHPMAAAEVGRVGVAIDTAADMCDVFAGISLDEVSVNFTINATAPIILATYLVAAERAGVPYGQLTGTLQNDILKEFLARKAYLYPPGPSLRLVTDVVAFSSRALPRFNPISVTGYHAREAGCDAVQELALTMASAIAYCDAFTARGLRFEEFAPRLSFHFATTLDLFEEVAKLRAARRIWHRVATERFGATSPAATRLRFFSGNSGTTLTAQQPLNNVIRSTLQCLGAVLGGAQSIHVMGYDEAYEIPSEEAVTLSLRTQQIIALESGVTRTVDPLAGSYYVEALTDELEARAATVLADIDGLGGAVAAIEAGVPQRWIAESAYRAEQELASGARPKVGVNVYADAGAAAPQPSPAASPVAAGAPSLAAPPPARLPIPPSLSPFAAASAGTFEVDPLVGARQAARTRARVAARDQRRHAAALSRLADDTREGRNVMPALIDAARAGATVGEMADVFRDAFGEFTEPAPW